MQRQISRDAEGPKRTRPRVRQLYTEGDTQHPTEGGIGRASGSGATYGSQTSRYGLPCHSSFQAGARNYDPDPRLMHRSKSCSSIGDLQRALEHLYQNYRQCRQCNSADIVQVKDKHDNILLVWCRNCSHSFGVDDSMEPEVLLDLYREGCIETTVGCCSNTNPDNFQIVGFDGSNLSVRCLNPKCQKVSVLGDQQQAMSDRGSVQDEPQAFVCTACGNHDREEMSVCLFRDEIRCVICNHCDQYIDFPEILRGGSDTSATLDPSEFVSCKCHPKDKNIQITRDDNGGIDIIACTNCQYFYLPKDPPRKKKQSKSSAASTCTEHSAQSWGSWLAAVSVGWIPYLAQGMQAAKDLKVQYREVHRLSEIRQGDHIMWDRREGYGHHAIVEHVNPNDISVVHYNGPSPSSQKIKGKIVTEQLDPFGRQHGRPFVVDYTSSLPADTVIQKAKSKLGEVEYSLLLNNCEHFATWCKTGQHVSAQVMKVIECAKKYATMCYDFANPKEASAKLEQIVELGLQKLPVQGLDKLSELGLDKSVLGFARYGGMALIVGTEVYNCIKDIQQKTEDRNEGRLSRDAYVEFVVSRVCRSVCGLSGLAIGLAFPPAGVAVLVGGTLGGLIGEFGGKQIGKVIVGYSRT